MSNQAQAVSGIRTVIRRGRRDIALSLGVGIVSLLLFHLDHLVASYSGWDDPLWWLHLVVDGGYVLIYGGLFFVMLRGWRLWRRWQGQRRPE